MGRCLRSLLVLVLCTVSASAAGKDRQPLVRIGPDGRLVYTPYTAKGDRIPDFSNCGYKGGGVAIPNVPVKVTLKPVAEGDDRERIQAALDTVAKLPLDKDGFRGAVLLKKGTYRVGGTLGMHVSGVVLRGEGDGEGGTVMIASAYRKYTVIYIAGRDGPAEIEDSKQPIPADYVPVGTRSFTVAPAKDYAVGDEVMVCRVGNQDWIHTMGMDRLSRGPGDKVHNWPAYTMKFRRVVTAVAGDTITVDAPIVNAIEREFGGGYVIKYTYPGRIENVGVEGIRCDSVYRHPTDHGHAWRFVVIDRAQNVWVRNCTAIHFAYSCVQTHGNAKWITVQDCQSLDQISRIKGGLRYPFAVASQLTLVQRCFSRHGRHDFVMHARVPGPNAFVDCGASHCHSDSGPHHRYALGTLYDNVRCGSLNVENRGRSGSGHGWAGAQMVFWNCRANGIGSYKPPTAQNFAIGCIANHWRGNGYRESPGKPIRPVSLYMKQLEDRLGPDAVERVSGSGGPSGIHVTYEQHVTGGRSPMVRWLVPALMAITLGGEAAAPGNALNAEACVRNLASPSLSLRRAAVAQLRSLPREKTVPLLPQLTALIAKRDKHSWFGQEAAAAVIEGMGPDAAPALPQLQKELIRALGETRWALSERLFRTVLAVDASAIQPVGPHLRKLLASKDARSVALGLALVGQAGPAAKTLVPDVIRHLEGARMPSLQRSAVRALGRIGAAAAPAVPALCAALQSKDAGMPREASEALAGVGAPAVPVLRVMLMEKDEAVRGAAADVLGHIGPAAKSALDNLQDARKGASKELDARIASAISLIGNKPPVTAEVALVCVEGKTLDIVNPLTDPDAAPGPLTIEIITEPRHGTARVVRGTTMAYRPRAGFLGEDSFTWRGDDGALKSKPAVAKLRVIPDRQGPVIADALADTARNEVLVRFDEPVDTVSATKAGNYRLDAGVTLKDLRAGPRRDCVTLSTSGLAGAKDLSVTVRNVRDRSKAANPGGGKASVVTLAPGVRYTYVSGGFRDFPDFAKEKPAHVGVTPRLGMVDPEKKPGFALLLRGMIHIPRDGQYTFHTGSDDGSRLYIGDRLVVDNGGLHGVEWRSGRIALTAGLHPVRVEFFDGGGGWELKTLWEGPDIRKSAIPPTALLHRPAPAP